MDDEEISALDYPKSFSNYSVIRKIGSGSFSLVCIVQNIKTEEKYAAKFVPRYLLQEKSVITHLEQELRIQESLDNENICKIIEIVYEEKFIIVVLEYCANGELFDYITRNRRLYYNDARRIFAQLVNAVNYMHSKNIAHRDLKPENIFLDHHYNVKLGDFGFAHLTDDFNLLSTSCGSIYYASPEIVRGEDYDGKASDVWSLGVVLFVMITGALPWSEQSKPRLFAQIMNAQYQIPPFVPMEIQNIIKACLKVNPQQRPTAEQLLHCSFVCGGVEAQRQIDEMQMRSVPKQTNTLRVVKKKRMIVRPQASTTRNQVPKVSQSFNIGQISIKPSFFE